MAAISPIILFNRVLNAGIALAVLADALGVGTILFALIEIFGPVSGAHFNPAVTLATLICGMMSWRRAVLYIIMQIAGGLTGMVFSHLMFYHEMPAFDCRLRGHSSGWKLFRRDLWHFYPHPSDSATGFRSRSKKISLVVGLLVGGELIATSSTMFANPQVTLARMFTYSAARRETVGRSGIHFDATHWRGSGSVCFSERYTERDFLINP